MPRVRDNYFLKNPVFYRLKPRVKHYAGGRAIVVPLNFDKEGGGGQWWSGADKMDIRIRNTINAAVYYRKNYSVACVVDRDEEDSVRGDTAIASLMDQKMNTCERTAVDAVGTSCFNSGTDPKALTGLDYALTPYTGGAPGTMPSQTFGGIARGASSANTWWNHQGDNTAYTDTDMAAQFKPIGLMWTKIMIASEKAPTLILSNHGSIQSFHNQLVKNERYLRPQSNSDLAKAGFENVMYKSAPWVGDARAPRTSGKVEKIYLLHEPAIHLYVHELRDMSFDPFQKSIDQRIRVGYVDWSGELCFDEMRCHGVISNFDASAVS